MNTGRTVFSQIMSWFPEYHFQKIIDRYRGNHRVRTFPCRDQFLSMAFAQLTFRDGLRDIETCLRALGSKLYHAGFHGDISRSTLADANEIRDWRIHAELVQILITRARRLYAQDDFGVTLKNAVYAFDSSTIDLCLALFPWAHFRRHKAAVKLHTLIDLRGSIPCFIRISDGKVHDVNALDDLIIEAGAFYLFDRGYVDFQRLYALSKQLAFFVTRAKSNMVFRVLESRPVDKTTGLRFDQTIRLTGPISEKDYPADQVVFRHQRERRQNTNLDCDHGLCVDHHHQEGAPARAKPRRNSANIERVVVRENRSISTSFKKHDHESAARLRKVRYCQMLWVGILKAFPTRWPVRPPSSAQHHL